MTDWVSVNEKYPPFDTWVYHRLCGQSKEAIVETKTPRFWKFNDGSYLLILTVDKWKLKDVSHL